MVGSQSSRSAHTGSTNTLINLVRLQFQIHKGDGSKGTANSILKQVGLK